MKNNSLSSPVRVRMRTGNVIWVSTVNSRMDHAYQFLVYLNKNWMPQLRRIVKVISQYPLDIRNYRVIIAMAELIKVLRSLNALKKRIYLINWGQATVTLIGKYIMKTFSRSTTNLTKRTKLKSRNRKNNNLIEIRMGHILLLSF